MAATNFGPFLWPQTYLTKFDSSTSQTLDAAADRHAIVFSVPKTGNITAVGWATRTVTSSQSVDVRLETIDGTTGYPSGTLIDSPTNQASATRATVASNTYYEETLTAAQAVTMGQVIACVVQFTGTAGTIQTLNLDSLASAVGFPYGVFNTTGTYAKNINRVMNIVLKYDDGSYYEVGCPPPVISTTMSVAYNSGSATDEYALKFTPQVPITVSGWWGSIQPATGGTYDIVLYDSDGITALKTVSYDGDNFGGTATSGHLRGYFNGTQILQAGVAYRLALKPTNTTNVTLYYLEFNSSAILGALSGGPNAFQSSRVDAGSWVDTATTKRPWLGLIVSAIDIGGGSYVIGG